MSGFGRRRLIGTVTRVCAIGLAISLGLVATALAQRGDRPRHSASRHVLLLSVDGLHQSDLQTYVRSHPRSTIAALVGRGVEFSNARTPVPSDSFPGLVAQVTGGNPKTTGVYYDDSYNPGLLRAGTTTCAGAPLGAEVGYFEQLDRDEHSLDAGQGLPGLPDSILAMTGDPRTVIDPAQLPVDPATCQPVYPHAYLRVNTVFEVARAAGLRTAWSDKHPAYEIVNGPSGDGVQDLFTPEINSDAPTAGAPNDWTADNALTQRYDAYKVAAVVNEIHGYDHSGTQRVGTPAIFGMNFQSVSTAQKLPTSGGQPGGYLAGGVTPGPVLSGALDFVDAQLGAMVAALRSERMLSRTTIILSAKHGQAPQDPAKLTRVPDGPILDGLNAAWKAAQPTAAKPLVAFSIDDDAMLLWLNDHSPQAAQFAKDYLLHHDGTGNGIDGQPKPYTASGLATAYAGQDAARYFGTAPGDQRVPDLYGITQLGTVYTAKQSKIAEHGGAGPEDRSVPLVVFGAGAPADGAVRRDPVETTQIAPTILRLLGLNPWALQAVDREHTPALRLG